MKVDQELRHLETGPSDDEPSAGIGTVPLVAACSGDAADVLARCREVLSIVLRRSGGGWPARLDWKQVLPGWFVERCAVPQSREEAERWLKWWKSLDRLEQVK